jgi:predicted TIM-barrel fold metal-dependent hydrolase
MSRDAADNAPACPGPPSVQPAPAEPLPPGAVDTHSHVIGGPPDHPYVSGRSYTPPLASAERYLAMLDAVGATYGVLTQVSVHGTDNSLLVDALRRHRERLRGIAVLALGAPDAERRALAEAGVVGLRLNVLYGGGIGFDRLRDYGLLCREMGWHLQFLIDAKELPALAPALGRLPVPFLVDHMGHFPTSRGVGDPGFLALLALVRDGAWVRLSGAYRTSVEGPPYDDTVAFAQALVAASPDRCVWGSDWPHVANWGEMMTVADLIALLARWIPDRTVHHRVLVDNPHRLFGFAPPRAR